MHAAPPQRSTAGATCPSQRVRAEPARELCASGVRRLSDLSQRLADLQAGSCRQVVDGEVEVDDHLITGKLPAIALARDGGKCSAIHDGDLPERVRPAIAGEGGRPTVPAEARAVVEHALREHPSLDIAGRQTIISTRPSSVGELPMPAAILSISATGRWNGICSANLSATLGLIVLMTRFLHVDLSGVDGMPEAHRSRSR